MRHAGEVPRSMEELTALPGVGRKTANVVLSVAFGLPGLPVDTHVTRLSRRLRLSDSDDPDRIEQDLCGLFPPEQWGAISLRLILHGRRVCDRPTPPLRELRDRRPVSLERQILRLTSLPVSPATQRAVPAAPFTGKADGAPCESRDRLVTSGHSSGTER